MLTQGIGEETHDRHNNRIAELFVGLGIGYVDPEFLLLRIKAHEACAFARRQPARPLALLRDQDFGAVLVVTGRQRARDIIRTEQAVAKSVAGSIVLGLVIFQILPELWRQRVFVVDFGFENGAKLWTLCGIGYLKRREVKLRRFTEAYNEDAFPLLWDPGLRADHAMLHVIAELVFQAHA